PAEFSVAYAIEASDDLRDWRPAGGGQVMALAAAPSAPASPKRASEAAPGPTQPLVGLPPDAPRFIRLRWADPATAPVLVGAESVAEQRRSRALDPPATLRLAASDEPGPHASEPEGLRALHIDLGGVLD